MNESQQYEADQAPPEDDGITDYAALSDGY